MKTLKRLGRAAQRYRVTGKLRAAPGPIIERFFGGKDCFFVQVGANDGIRGDPLHSLIKANPRWRGIFIEPQQQFFSRLVENYGESERFTFEKLAVSDITGKQPFFTVSEETVRETGMPASVNLIGSLNRDHVLRSLKMVERHYKFLRPLDACISQDLVHVEPLMSVLDRQCVGGVDLLHTDAESDDYRIIRQLDFNRFQPKLILYEHANLADQEVASRFLRERGYRTVNCGRLDTMAIRL